MDFKNQNALVVFSGGQDSTTCLFWAIKNFKSVSTICFDYGQRHSIELECAKTIADKWNIPFKQVSLEAFTQIGGNSLIDHDMEIGEGEELPNTFVPGRNLIFLTFAAAWAFNNDIEHIVTGVCQTDYSGYPDCRENTMQALQSSLNLGMDSNFTIHTPLMFLNKAQSVELAKEVGALDALAYSHTCYEGQFPPCGKCPSCKLRANGFKEAGLEDPLVVRANNA